MKVRAFVPRLVVVTILLVTSDCAHSSRDCSDHHFRDSPIPDEWILRTAEPAEVDRQINELVSSVDQGKIPPSAVADVRRSVEVPWLAVKRRMKPGDILWYYKSPPETWAGLYGREGYLLVRNCRVLGDYLLSQN